MAVIIPEEILTVPSVEIPEMLNAVPTRLSEIVIVAPTPDAVATILLPTKFRLEILAAEPTIDPSSLIVRPVKLPANELGDNQKGSCPEPPVTKT